MTDPLADRMLAVLAHAAVGHLRLAMFGDPTASFTLVALITGIWIAGAVFAAAVIHLWHRAVARPRRAVEPEWLPDNLPSTPEKWGQLHDLETDFHAPSARGHSLPRRDARPRRIPRALPMRPERRTQTRTRKVR